MKSKTQVVFIHGGMTFLTQKDYIHFLKTRPVSTSQNVRWQDSYLKEKLGSGFEVIKPRMPLQDNSRYLDWKLHFERFIPLLRDGVVLIGSSLGGIFLAKYLSEHKFPKRILSTYLVCAPFDDTVQGEDLCNGFKLKSNLSLLEDNCPNLVFMFSKDDNVVPVAHAEKYRKKLKNAKIIIYESKNGHFQIEKFPEIIKMIKVDAKKN